MNWTDDTLMAYADGELTDPPRSEVERALAADAALRARVEAMQAQRTRLTAAFAPVLDEPLPQRLLELLQPAVAAPAATVTRLDAHRAAREPASASATAPAREGSAATPRTAAMAWAHWGGMAAALLLGVMLGTQLDRDDAGAGLGLRDGNLIAGGPVGAALSTQLASAPAAGAAVAVQLSFVDQTGRYCRTFSSAGLAGLACRDGAQWRVQALAATDPAAPTGMRQAASPLPRAVLDAVDAQIAGRALDAVAERAARDAGWRR